MTNGESIGMDKTDAIHIRPIINLKVFDLAVVRYRSPYTDLGLCIDDTNIYGISVSGEPTISSGENTVGAFRSDDMNSLIAWLDPISNEFLRRRNIKSYNILASIFLTNFLGLLFVKISKMPYATLLLLLSIILSVMTLLIFSIKEWLENISLEQQLRLTLNLNSTKARPLKFSGEYFAAVMNGDQPNYANYSEADLRQVLTRIDKERFPDRVLEIETRLREFSNGSNS